MKIGIYCETVKATNKTGISRYVIGLVEALLREAPENDYYLYYQKQSVFESKMPWLLNQKNVKHRAIYSPTNLSSNRPRLWWDYVLPFHIWKDKLDVFHGPNHFLPKTQTSTVLTIHDLAYYFMDVHGPNFDAMLKAWTNKAMQRATRVIAVSDSTKQDCINEGCDGDKIETIYQGFESNISDIKSTPSRSDPYILFLGTIQPRKNILRLIEAYSFLANKIPHRLIVAGAPGECFQDVVNLIEREGLADRVELTGFISDQQRQKWYQGASCFVYPSKYEGFGLVVLEAMSYGVPVIATNNSSLPEAVGEAGILVADDAVQLSDAIFELITNPSRLQEFINLGYKHIEKFDWKTCAQKTLSSYKNAALKSKG